MYKVVTNHPLASTSPDHIYPQGTKNTLGGPDYSWKDTYNPFADEVIKYFNKPTISVLDLGAASGYLVKDFLARGCDAVGLEGSNWPLKNNVENWVLYNNKRLFTCDIGRPFSILLNNNPVKFDLINAWEVIEHIDPSNLNVLAQNVLNHLNDDGIFVFSLSPWFEPSVHDSKINLHLSYNINKKHEWEKIFSDFEFVGPVKETYNCGYHYMFENRYRGKIREQEGKKHTFWSTLMKKKR